MQAVARGGVHPGRNPGALTQEEGPDIVDAVGLVGVVVGEQNRVQPLDLRRDGLFPQVWRGIDQNGGLRPLPLAPVWC